MTAFALAHPWMTFVFALAVLYVCEQQFANCLRIYIGWRNDRLELKKLAMAAKDKER